MNVYILHSFNRLSDWLAVLRFSFTLHIIYLMISCFESFKSSVFSFQLYDNNNTMIWCLNLFQALLISILRSNLSFTILSSSSSFFVCACLFCYLNSKIKFIKKNVNEIQVRNENIQIAIGYWSLAMQVWLILFCLFLWGSMSRSINISIQLNLNLLFLYALDLRVNSLLLFLFCRCIFILSSKFPKR